MATRVGLECFDLIFGIEPCTSCSARLETSNTYRNLLSMPSGKPSITFLLESLGHLGDRFERRSRLQLLGDDRGLEAFRGLAEIIVDDHVLIELFAGVDL